MPGEKVVVIGMARVRPGMPVNPVEELSATAPETARR
jgi:hypothetical protein